MRRCLTVASTTPQRRLAATNRVIMGGLRQGPKVARHLGSMAAAGSLRLTHPTTSTSSSSRNRLLLLHPAVASIIQPAAVFGCCSDTTTTTTTNNILTHITTRQYNTTHLRLQAAAVDDDNDASASGDVLYSKYVETIQEMERLKAKEDEERSQKMFQAWQKSQNAAPKSQGVAVVKTLAKEARKETTKKSKLLSSPSSSDTCSNDLESQAMKLLERAAMQKEHPEALVQWGNRQLDLAKSITRKMTNEEMLSSPEALEHVQGAMDSFHRAGMVGNRIGWYNLGQLYWTGFPAAEDEEIVDSDDDEEYIPPSPSMLPPQLFPKDMHEAMDCFHKAIDLGDVDAMYLVGVHRMTTGGKENIHSGFNLVQRAASEGHGGAQYYVALLNLNGQAELGLEACSESEFVTLLDKAVEEGNSVDAMFTRGHSYFHGSEGYPQNHELALRDFLRAAEEGHHADSAVSAGAILHNGYGVPKDQRRAFELYQLAGELGSKEGWKNVVACYTTGEGVPQSLETARYITETMLKNKE